MTVAITDVVLRDAHQSLFATRLRLDDMLPVAAQLDDVGYRSLECWGGATFDACIRFLGEDPWVRLRELKKAMPKTPLQMLLRGQNLLGYRHYADDVVERFVERAVKNGMDVFRVFDAMNDPRNMQAALQAVRRHGAHAQGTLSYTTSPAHTLQTWLDLTEQLLETGVDSVAIKDMSGILTPHAAFELVSEIKKRYDVTLHLHCHATTGMAEMALLKAIEAGVDGVDTAISSMSATYGHPATEALVATLAGTPYDTGLDIHRLENIAAYFREVRKKYHAFEGQLKGTDSRILVAQVPGGMLTNLEGQLKQQSAAHRLDEVLAEIPACARTSASSAGDPDLADCRHPGGAQRPDRRALQNHREGDRRYPEGRVRPHPGPGERRPAGAGARRRRPGDLPPGRPAEAGAGAAGSRRQTPGAGEGHHACRKRHRRRAHRGAVPAARPEVPRKPPQPGSL